MNHYNEAAVAVLAGILSNPNRAIGNNHQQNVQTALEHTDELFRKLKERNDSPGSHWCDLAYCTDPDCPNILWHRTRSVL